MVPEDETESQGEQQPDNEPAPPETEELEDELVSTVFKVKCFLKYHWRGIVAIITPLILLPIILPTPTEKYQWCGYTLCMMGVYWVTECVPLPITSFLPLFIFPLTNVMDSTTTSVCYINDSVFMFLGSLMLAAAVEQSGLHKRLALGAIRCIGYSHYKLLLAMCFITMFVSMWITNTAATTMMVPINFALLKVFEDQKLLTIYEMSIDGELQATDITTCYFCAATFSATIGGIGTLVGTATNLVFKGLFHGQYKEAPEYLSFPMFSAFSIPYMILMEICMYLYMIIVYFGFLRPNSEAAKSAQITPEAMEAAKEAVDGSWKELGKITFWEITVSILFTGAMVMFFCRSPQMFVGWGDLIVKHFDIEDKKFIRDSACALFVCFLMLLFPSTLYYFKNFTAKKYEDLPKHRISSVLDWTKMNASLPYSFMFLLGGGFALSTAAKPEYSNLNGKIGAALRNLKNLPNLLVVFIVILMTVFFTNFASNVAVCNVVVPIAMTLAEEINQNPLLYNLAAGFSASYCFCIPVGTPGNLVVQSAAKIPTQKMIIAGVGPSATTIILTWLAVAFWSPVIWPDITTLPDWAQLSGSI